MLACTTSAWDITPPVIFTLLTALGVLWLTWWVKRQRVFPGYHSFSLIHLACVWWLLVTALEMALAAPDCKVFWAVMAWPSIIGMPTCWAVFLWQYVNSLHTPLAVSRRIILGLMPLLFWGMALSNPWHGLLYGAGTAPLSDEPGAPIRYQHGALFYLAAVYVYLLMLFCFGIVVRAASMSKGLHRRHYFTFAAVTAVPWAANISYVVFGWTIFDFDPTPFSFALTLAAFAWLIVGVRLFDLLPVARHLLLDALLDPVLVVDPRYRVIEANPAALALASSPDNWEGQDLQTLPVCGAALYQRLMQGIEDKQESLLMLDNGTRYYEMRVRAIKRDTREGPIALGQILYLRDVTQRHSSELKLAAALALSEERLRTISHLHEQLWEQALRDPLTGLYNRRYLDEFFNRELARAQRSQTSFAVALIDLDHFKRLNDEHGHLIGDDVLKAVGAFLLDNVRNTDAVFRIGGEEFLLIMPGVSAAEASERLQKICTRLALTPMATRVGDYTVTLSAGFAHWPEQGQTLDELMHKADAALYAAKHAGRNRVLNIS